MHVPTTYPHMEQRMAGLLYWGSDKRQDLGNKEQVMKRLKGGKCMCMCVYVWYEGDGQESWALQIECLTSRQPPGVQGEVHVSEDEPRDRWMA